MTLTPENMQSKKGEWKTNTIEADILQMDVGQLKSWFAAIVMGQYFKKYPNISSFPENLRLHRIDVIGKTLGSLFAESRSSHPDFRGRLSTVLLHILTDAGEGKNDPESPDIRRNQEKLIEACIETVSTILYDDGEESMGRQFEATVEEIAKNNDGHTTVDGLMAAIDANEELIIDPEHVPLLQAVARLAGSYDLGGIIESYLDILPKD